MSMIGTLELHTHVHCTAKEMEENEGTDAAGFDSRPDPPAARAQSVYVSTKLIRQYPRHHVGQ